MISGLYSAADGLLVQSTRADIMAGNLAGMAAAAYRRDVPAVSAFARIVRTQGAARAAGIPGAGLGIVATARTDLRPGSIRHTGNKLDIALDGPGYFCVVTGGGEAYTRSGALRLGRGGKLLTASGDPLLGQAGAIRITGSQVEIAANGDVVVDGARVDRLKLADFCAGARVQKLGSGLLAVKPGDVVPLPAGEARVRQGALEEANVNPVHELASLISGLRAFEASQRALRSADDTLRIAINEIARG